ncbi:MAG: hypothetical protein M3163_12605 [Actinomycetota bacterium]|nr:hypothetical protein [Actinomycetota bacterium]
MGTRVRLTRSGGLAGLSMVASVDLDELPQKTAAEVRAALDALDFDTPDGRRRREAGSPPAFGAGAADTFQYDLEVIGEKRRSLTVREPLPNPQLRTLVDVLLPLAQPE